MTHRRRCAFTLVELLVVIGIIAILITLLFPALSRASALAKQTKCASQLRQIGVAVQIYAASNGGFLIPTNRSTQMFNGNEVAPDRPGLGWSEHVASALKLKNAKLFHCEVYPPECEFSYFMTGMYVAGLPTEGTMRASEIRMSGRYVLAAECTNLFRYRPPIGGLDWPFDDCDRDDAGVKLLLFKYDEGGVNMHPGGNNVLFDDGHVAAFEAWIPSAMTMHPKQMSDWDGLLGN